MEPPKRAKPKKKKTTPKAAAEEIKLLQRQTWATDLKTQGLSYRRIAKRMKELKLVPTSYSDMTAYRDVEACMARVTSEQKELAMQNLYLDLRRYDELFEKAWALALPKAADGEMELPPDPVYFGAVQSILQTRAVLLNYKSLYADDKKNEPTFNLNADWDSFTVEELLTIQHKIQAGEDAILVVTQIQESRKRQDTTPT